MHDRNRVVHDDRIFSTKDFIGGQKMKEIKGLLAIVWLISFAIWFGLCSYDLMGGLIYGTKCFMVVAIILLPAVEITERIHER